MDLLALFFDFDERDCHCQTNFSASGKTVSLQFAAHALRMHAVCVGGSPAIVLNYKTA